LHTALPMVVRIGTDVRTFRERENMRLERDLFHTIVVGISSGGNNVGLK
jgi:hypothetical protein